MDLILRSVRLPDGALADVAVQDGHVAAIGEGLTQAAKTELAGEERLLLPAFVNPHLHACKSLWRQELARQPEAVRSLHRFEALSHVKRGYTEQSVFERGVQLIRLAIRAGTGAIRLFADVDEQAGLRAFLGLKRLQAAFPFMQIQVVPFPQNGFARHPGNQALLAEAAGMGCDAIGAVPWLEPSVADQQAHISFCLDLARQHGLPLHAVADDTEDPQSRTGAMLAEAVLKVGGWPLLLTQLGSLAFQDDAEAARTAQLIRQARATVISNGHIELITCQDARQPQSRGNTRVKELLAAGVRVLAAQDDVDNPYYPFGRNDPLDVALMLAHVAQLAWDDDLETVRRMVGEWAAQALGLNHYGLAVGDRADLVLLDAPSWRDALQFQPARRYVILQGQLRAEERRDARLYLD